MYDDIYRASMTFKDPLIADIDFVVVANTAANRLLTTMEKTEGTIDFGAAAKKWDIMFKEMLKEEAKLREDDKKSSATSAPAAPLKTKNAKE
jgi:hypothetical protein